jgi:hypothetical protein
MVAGFRNYRALFIFQRGDIVGVSVFEVNCDRHGFAYLESSLLLRSAARVKVLDNLLLIEEAVATHAYFCSTPSSITDPSELEVKLAMTTPLSL